MKGKKVNKNLFIVVLSVLVLTFVSLNVSYSAFFTIKSQSTIQQITAGVLDVVIDNSSTAMSASDLMPFRISSLPTAANSMEDTSYPSATLVLSNNGGIDAAFSVALTYDDLPVGKTINDVLPFMYLNVGIVDVDNNAWVNFGTNESPAYYVNISRLTPSATNVYPILRDTIDASDTREYRIYTWVAEDTPISEIGKLVYLKLDVKSTTRYGNLESGE